MIMCLIHILEYMLRNVFFFFDLSANFRCLCACACLCVCVVCMFMWFMRTQVCIMTWV